MTYFFKVPDKKRNYQGYMVFVLTILWTAVTSAIVSIGFYFFPQEWLRWVCFEGISFLIAVTCLTLNHNGHRNLASWCLALMLWSFFTVSGFSAGGIKAPAILSQMSIILTAGFLLGATGGLVIGLLSIVADFVMAYMEVTGYLPPPSVVHTPITYWIAAIVGFATILALQYYATNHLRSSLGAMQQAVRKREEAEKITNETLHNLGERVKELRTLYAVSRILQDDKMPPGKLFQEIVDVLPAGWQFPDITAARVYVAEKEYTTQNYRATEFCQRAEMKTDKGTTVGIEVVYLQSGPEFDEGPFLKEERNLINALVEMLKIDLERKEVEEKIKQSDERNRAMIDNMSDGLVLLNSDWEIVYQSPSVKRITGYSFEERQTKEATELIHPDDVEVLNEAIRKAMESPGVSIQHQLRVKHKSGNYIWIDGYMVNLLDNPSVRAVMVNYSDITERKEANEKIRQSEQLLRKITSQIPGNTYMFEIDENGFTKVLFMNRGTDSFNRAPEPDDYSKYPEKLREVIHDDDKALFNEAMKEAQRTGSEVSCQYRVIANNQVRWRWMQAVPEQGQNGKMVWYGATSDITPLVDYLASVEQIIFDIGHVIRRPISSMLGMTKLINDSNFTEAELREISRNLYTIAEEMDVFIRELNTAYHQKRESSTKFNIDIASSIDKRSSLFT